METYAGEAFNFEMVYGGKLDCLICMVISYPHGPVTFEWDLAGISMSANANITCKHKRKTANAKDHWPVCYRLQIMFVFADIWKCWFILQYLCLLSCMPSLANFSDVMLFWLSGGGGGSQEVICGHYICQFICKVGQKRKLGQVEVGANIARISLFSR